MAPKKRARQPELAGSIASRLRTRGRHQMRQLASADSDVEEITAAEAKRSPSHTISDNSPSIASTPSGSAHRVSPQSSQVQSQVRSSSPSMVQSPNQSSETSPVQSPESSQAQSSSYFPEGSLSPIQDLLFPAMSKLPLPYDPSDRKSISQHKQAQLDAQFPERCTPSDDPLSDRFLNSLSEARFHQFQQRKFHEERYVNLSLLPSKLRELIEQCGWERTISPEMVQPYIKDAVLEFYANFPPNGSRNLLVPVYVRGKIFEFSPRMINRVFGTPNEEMATGKVSAKQVSAELMVNVSKQAIAQYLSGTRVRNFSDLRPRHLTHTLGSLFGLCCLNWIPTTNNTTLSLERAKLLYKIKRSELFNFGKLVFDQILKVVQTPADTGTLPFPSLIFQVLDFQRKIPLLPHELLSPKPLLYKLDVRVGAARPKMSVPGYVFGKDLGQDLRQAASLLTTIADHFEGGDYDHDLSEYSSNEDDPRLSL